jgi:predicted nucleotidyltransferase
MTRGEAIVEITRRLVEYHRPERIYLFGSVARGDEARTPIWVSWW